MKSTYVAILLAASVMVSVPFTASASVLVGSVDASVLSATSNKPTLSGMTFGATEVRVLVRKIGSTKSLYRSKRLSVQSNRWETQVTKKLTDGVYTVEVVTADSGSKIVSEVLVVGGVAQTPAASPTVLSSLIVAPVPLLSGGVASGGGTVPISYLQMTNTGKAALSLKGFGVAQRGSAPVQAIVGLTVVDDQGVVRGTVAGATLFDGQQAFAPADVVFAPGQMRLFTIKATLSSAAALYTGKQLMLEVVSVHTDATAKGSFPIRGTTWTIQ